MPKKILRVFVRRTSQTPNDDLVRIGLPEMFLPEDIDETHISVLFTWDIEEAKSLITPYSWQFPNIPIRIGGPGYGYREDPDEFTPGKYTKKGITITTRGCDFSCPWCLVPGREGRFREIEIQPGNIIQDNNILLSSKPHLQKVFQMLRTQKQIRFLGGLDKRLLKDWHVEELRSLKIKELWLAFDSWDNGLKFVKAVEKLKKAGFSRNQIRCYVLAGFNEPIQLSETRLRVAYNLGVLPYVQVYQSPEGKKRMAGERSREDNLFVRRWSRPAIIKTMMGQCQKK